MADKLAAKDFMQPTHKGQWCPGCGNFGIVASLQRAFAEGGYTRENTVVVSGIGCSGKAPHYYKTYGYESIHGRALPVASGVKLANPRLNVVACGGDGDGYGIGTAHFIHTARRNINMLYVVHNNRIYALTKNQYSPVTEKGHKSTTSPHGAIEDPLNPLITAIAVGATFVARGYSNDIAKLSALMQKAMKHNGFALIDVVQPCVTWRKDRLHTVLKDRIYEVKDLDTSSKTEAIKFLLQDEQDEKIATGIFYQVKKPTYEEQLKMGDNKTPVAKQPVDNVDIGPLLDKLE